MNDRKAGARANPWQKVLLVSGLMIVRAKTGFSFKQWRDQTGWFQKVKWTTRKGRSGYKNNTRMLALARAGHGAVLGAAIRQTASSVFSGRGPALVLTRADSHSCSGLRPVAFIGRGPSGRSAQKVRIRHMNHVVASRLPDTLPVVCL